ncbi:hypothetical protein QVD17_16942 [Tagetes erecta]|uniref:Uncharacterized protein n=1 Tax=Tagetes erecta TaxID=13708 RepID=A0AAD8KRG9_TARER|nr:hypothetical protein QVD17_16942 [Tagetes erecta]
MVTKGYEQCVNVLSWACVHNLLLILVIIIFEPSLTLKTHTFTPAAEHNPILAIIFIQHDYMSNCGDI